MAITVTNAAGIVTVEQALRSAAASRVTGASANTVEILCIGDSMSSTSLVPRTGVRTREVTWFHRMVKRLKEFAGDAGATWTAAHGDESYGGGRYVAGVGTSVDAVREHGISPFGTYLASKMGHRPYSGLMTDGVAMGKLYARPYNGYPIRVEPTAFPWRFLDVVYTKAAAGIGIHSVSVDGGAATTFTGVAGSTSYNNLQTIDATSLSVHDLVLDSTYGGEAGQVYGRYEALRFRTGLPGVIDRSVASSGLKWDDLNTTFTTDALRNVYMGNTAFGTPELAVIMLGYNDGAAASWNAASQTTIKESTVVYADLLIAAGCPVMWVIPPANDGASTRRTEWNAIKTYVLANVADATKLTVVDCHDGITGWTTGAAAVTSGYIYGANLYRPWTHQRQVMAGDIVTPIAGPDGTNVYECTTAGTTHTAEPTWDTNDEAVTADNTVNWTTRRAAALIVSDATHPTPKGHSVLAEAILAALGWDMMIADWRGVGGRLHIGL
jgi:lysophospholipase L1-like esterase